MDKKLVIADPHLRPRQRRNDATGYSLPHPKGIADGQHQVTHFKVVGVTKGQGSQFLIAHINIENGQVAALIRKQQLCFKLAFVGKHHPDIRAATDHVVVCHNQTRGIDDHPGTK